MGEGDFEKRALEEGEREGSGIWEERKILADLPKSTNFSKKTTNLVWVR